jgi:hypothetical protein
MNRKTIQGIGIMFFAMLCAMALVCACTIRKTPDATTLPETTVSETTKEPVRVKPHPHREEPTATPTPTPASVYIPREELPDGQVLDKGCYAVLPGEGAYCNVFDCYGKQIASFSFISGDRTAPVGIYTEQSLSEYYRFNESEVQSILPETEERSWIKSNENGFYEMDYEKGQVILYNKAGEHIQTLSQDPDVETPEDEFQWVDMVVESYENETVVSFSTNNWIPETSSVTIYFVAADGTINDTCAASNLPDSVVGLLGRKYYIVSKEKFELDDCDVYDFEGKLIMENVSIEEEDALTLCSNEAATYIQVVDYYVKNRNIYDSSFQAISKNEVDSDGNLIYGVKYDVEGITCTAKYWREGHIYFGAFAPSGLVAMGTQDGRIAIKTYDSEYVFDCIGDYYSMNDYVLVLKDINENMQVISLETGDVLYEMKNTNHVSVSTEYILVSFDPFVEDFDDIIPCTYIIDKDGNVRYVSQNATAHSTLGEYIVLYRGPYVGIADLNGEWIMKALTWEMTRDEEFVYTW